MQSLTIITFIASKKMTMLKFLPSRTIIRPASSSNANHYIDSHFSCKSNSRLKRNYTISPSFPVKTIDQYIISSVLNSYVSYEAKSQFSPPQKKSDFVCKNGGWGCSSVGRAWDWYAANAGSIPRCSKGFFPQSQLSVQTLQQCPYTPVCNRMH